MTDRRVSDKAVIVAFSAIILSFSGGFAASASDAGSAKSLLDTLTTPASSQTSGAEAPNSAASSDDPLRGLLQPAPGTDRSMQPGQSGDVASEPATAAPVDAQEPVLSDPIQSLTDPADPAVPKTPEAAVLRKPRIGADGYVDLNDIVRQLAPGQNPPNVVNSTADSPMGGAGTGSGAMRSIDLAIAFAFDDAALLDEAARQLEALGGALKDPLLRDERILIIGHTDTKGAVEYNRDLSDRRAKAVADYLVSNLGIDARRLEARGLGESRPIEGIDGTDARNRRVEVSVIEGG